MKAFLLLALATVALAFTEAEYERSFVQWMAEHKKSYETSELFYRFDVYKANLDKIEAHNALGLTWTMGSNQFMDLTADEFGQTYLKGLLKPRKALGDSTCTTKTFTKPTTTSIDWVAKGAVTDVKDQGQCGSCWSFSTTGAVEGRHFLATGQLVALSEQQLMDCSWRYGNLGCNGGLMDNAFRFLIDNGGSCTEAEYPYTGVSSHTCKTCTQVAQIASCSDVTVKDPVQLQAAVLEGPVSIAIEADQSAFQLYNGGVLTGRCGENLDHGVLLVGFDLTDATPYWKVKNSWGPKWGEAGYIRIAIAGDLCGVQDAPSLPF